MRETWEQMVNRIAECRTCHCTAQLAQTGSRPLFQRTPPQNSLVLFVLEAPNWDDTFDENKGYLTYDDDTDPTGVLFRDLFTKELGEPIATVAVTNSVLCLPGGKRGKHPVPAAMTKACSGHLRTQIDVIDPLIVAPVGLNALDATRRIEDHRFRKLGEAVRNEVSWQGRVLFPLAHPGVLGLTHRNERRQREDWRMLRLVLAHERRRRRCGDFDGG